MIGASIINISSVVSTLGFPNASVYAGTKCTVDSITRSLAKEPGPRGIRVNAINPGMVETEGTHSAASLKARCANMWKRKRPSVGSANPMTSRARRCSWRRRNLHGVSGETLVFSGGNR